jgi:hypothetical protein
VDGIQLHKVKAVSQSKSEAMYESTTLFTLAIDTLGAHSPGFCSAFRSDVTESFCSNDTVKLPAELMRVYLFSSAKHTCVRKCASATRDKRVCECAHSQERVEINTNSHANTNL